MTSHSLFLRILPGLFFLALALLSFLLGFKLEIVSWLAATFCLLVFERLLALLAPGARAESRWVFGGLGLALAPVFFQAGLTSMSDGLGLALMLSAFYFGLRTLETRKTSHAIWGAALTVLAISTCYSLAALLLPLGISLAYNLFARKKWLALAGALFAGLLAMLLHIWLKTNGAANPLAHSSLEQWSGANFFQHSFEGHNGSLSHYLLPNILFLLYPLAHPAFCMVLPGLFFLFKKTDLVLPAKKTLLVCIAAYLVLLGGMPQQNLRELLPAYALVLLLLFPAWDRLYCYGFLFFRRLTWGILITALSLQLFFCAKYLFQ